MFWRRDDLVAAPICKALSRDAAAASFVPRAFAAARAAFVLFEMPGFVFHLRVGKDLVGWIQETCFVRGTGGPLIVGSYLEQGIGDLASGVLNEDDGAECVEAVQIL